MSRFRSFLLKISPCDQIFRGNNGETVITKEKGETEALLVAISTMDVKTRGSY